MAHADTAGAPGSEQPRGSESLRPEGCSTSTLQGRGHKGCGSRRGSRVEQLCAHRPHSCTSSLFAATFWEQGKQRVICNGELMCCFRKWLQNQIHPLYFKVVNTKPFLLFLSACFCKSCFLQVLATSQYESGLRTDQISCVFLPKG